MTPRITTRLRQALGLFDPPAPLDPANPYPFVVSWPAYAEHPAVCTFVDPARRGRLVHHTRFPPELLPEVQVRYPGIVVQSAIQCWDCGGEAYSDYMVHDAVWTAGGQPEEVLLHRACLEQRLGRRIVAADYTTAPLNSMWEGAEPP